MAILDGLQSLGGYFLVESVFEVGGLFYACGVDESELPALVDPVGEDRVASGPGQLVHHHPSVVHYRVHQRGLAHVGPSDDAQIDALIVSIDVLTLFVVHHALQYRLRVVLVHVHAQRVTVQLAVLLRVSIGQVEFHLPLVYIEYFTLIIIILSFRVFLFRLVLFFLFRLVLFFLFRLVLLL